MRRGSLLVLALLSVAALGYGATAPVLADNHDIPPLSVAVDKEFYLEGDRVTVTGSIKNFDSSKDSGKALTFRLVEGTTLISVGQILPESDGTFTFDQFIAGGAWKNSGVYSLQVRFGANTQDIEFNYAGGADSGADPDPPAPPPVEPEVPPTPPPPPPPEPVTPPEPVEPEEPEITCGAGTVFKDGQCVVEEKPEPEPSGGGCLIATAAYGTELAPQVQLLREVRDGAVMSTASGAAFMAGFNSLYYSFSPTVADWERESPVLRDAVRALITPMVSTLSIMTLADEGSEAGVLGLGISVIALNLAMYVAAPALVSIGAYRAIRGRS